MQRIEIKDNPLQIEVYVNGKPDLTLIPKDLMDAFITTLTEELITRVK